MEKYMNAIEKSIYKDCSKNMWNTLVINVLSESLDAVIVAAVVSFLGNLANSILNNSVTNEKYLLYKILFCLIFLIVIVPIMDLVKNLLMLKGALAHDRCLYLKYLQMEYDKIREIEPGEIQNRLENDLIDFRFYWMEITTKCIVVVILTVFLGIQCRDIPYFYVLAVVIISVLRSVFPMIIRRYERKLDLDTRDYEANNKSLENEFFSNIAFSKKIKISKVYINLLKEYFISFFETTKKKQLLFDAFSNNFTVLLERLSYIVILLIGCFFVKNKMIMLGAVIKMLGYSSIFDRVCYDIGFIIRKKTIITNSCNRISLFYNNKENTAGESYLPKREIKIKKLSFFYKNMSVLRDYSNRIYINQKNVIVGDNGSGKTTLLKILYGLEKDYKGEILFDNRLFSVLDMDYWRENIGVAFQNPIVFEGSVKENITLFVNNVNNGEADRLICELGLQDVKDRLLTDNEKRISGGELQKISIARALMRKPYILFLDEPNNHLDSDADNWLYDFIKNYKGTLVYIAHSKRFIDLADNIVQM